MKNLITILIAAMLFVSCNDSPTFQNGEKDILVTFVYKVPPTDTEPLNFYYFYINGTIDTSSKVEFRVDLDNNGKAAFKLPSGVSAVQRSSDSITVTLSKKDCFGAVLFESFLNKGKYSTPKQNLYLNGNRLLNGSLIDAGTYSFMVAEYQNNKLVRKSDYAIGLVRKK